MSLPIEHPIIFDETSMKLLLNGRKTCVRTVEPYFFRGKDNPASGIRCCMPGDYLWVREALRPAVKKSTPIRQDAPKGIMYAADGLEIPNEVWMWKYKSMPASGMPRQFSRFRLRVLSSYTENLWDISALGLKEDGFDNIGEFVEHWNRRHRGRPWKDNPIVKVIAFQKPGIEYKSSKIDGTPILY